MTLQIEVFPLGPLGTNAYLVSHPTENKAFIIDPGAKPKSLIKRIEGLEIEAIVLTHGHFDHIAGVDEIRKLKGCPVYIHDLEADWLTTPKLNGSLMWPNVTPPIETDPAEFALADKQKLTLLGETFTVLHTPGHSPGSVCLVYNEHLFAGDLLFRLSVGRTDLAGGNSGDLLDSIQRKIFPLPEGTIVYPGHGPKTTVGYEKANNPYV